MASIYQSIEILSKEKGIDAQIVVDAVKDAILVAASPVPLRHWAGSLPRPRGR